MIDDYYGTVMLDEMKFKHDIYCNMITSEIIRLFDNENFVSVGDNARGIIHSINSNEKKNTGTEGDTEVSEDDTKNEDTDLVSVSCINQHRFRS